MPSRFTATLFRLAAITCFGSVLSVLGFVAVRPHGDSLAYMLVCAAFVMVGICLVYWAPYQLREGVRNERWPAEEIDSLRRIVDIQHRDRSCSFW